MQDGTKGKAKDIVEAMVSDDEFPAMAEVVDGAPVGGIDFNPDLLDLQIKRDKYGVPLPVQQQPLLYPQARTPQVCSSLPVR